jgi:hypothetical protein
MPENSMETYILYRRQDGTVVAVKKGFSWPAFFFGPFWAFSKGLTGVGIGLLGLGVMSGAINHSLTVNSPVGLSLLVWVAPLILPVIVGFEANGHWRQRLEQKGFQPTGEFRAWASDLSATIDSFQESQAPAGKQPDLVECPRCDAMIPPGEPKCPKCGWH